jgi:hypothetical protein
MNLFSKQFEWESLATINFNFCHGLKMSLKHSSAELKGLIKNSLKMTNVQKYRLSRKI